MMKIDKINFIDYTLLLITIAVSGIPYFSNSILFIPVFVVLFSVFLLRKKRVDWNFVLLFTLLVIITIVQTYVFNFYSIQTIIGFFLRVVIAYLIVKILGEKFISYFINILYVMAIISLPIYFSLLLFPGMLNILLSIAPVFNILNFANDSTYSIIIYTLNILHIEDSRNVGPFWESGAFAGYLLLAYMFNFYSEEKNKTRKSIILLITIFTTLSTTSYLALFVFLFFTLYQRIKNIFIRILAVSIIFIGGYYAFISFNFLGPKIESQLDRARGADPYKGDKGTQRFLTIKRDIEDFKGHEIVGRGSNPVTRFSYGPLDQIRTVGLTDIIVRMGLPFFLLMMYFMYLSIYNYLVSQKQQSIFNCLSLFIAILITLMSEVYFTYPLYWSLLFLQFVYNQKEKVRII